MSVVHTFVFINHFLERSILGLDFEVRGHENLPEGACIIAAKHQSAYETTKLHILLEDPAIILKKELLKIPLWGLYLAKSDVIAIDRSSPKAAIESIQKGALRMKEQGRQIVIFPQGTRVATHVTAKDRPYKIGVVRVQEATNLPIIPLAMNSGVFWPRNSWFKKPGKIVFEFLPPVQPGNDAGKTLSALQDKLENRSDRLMEEGRYQLSTRRKKNWKIPAAIIACLMVLAYTANWMIAANLIVENINRNFDNLEKQGFIKFTRRPEPVISGFPGKLRLELGKLEILSPAGTISAESIHAASWPFFRMPIAAEIRQAQIKQRYWLGPVNFESIRATIRPWSKSFNLIDSEVHRGEFTARANGQVNLENEGDPQILINFILENEEAFIKELQEKEIIHQQQAIIAATTFSGLKRNGATQFTLTSRGNAVYMGPFKLYQFKTRRTIHTANE